MKVPLLINSNSSVKSPKQIKMIFLLSKNLLFIYSYGNRKFELNGTNVYQKNMFYIEKKTPKVCNIITLKAYNIQVDRNFIKLCLLFILLI